MVGTESCFEEEILKHHVRQFFRVLYRISGMFSCNHNFPVLIGDEISNLVGVATDEEVRKAVFSMAPLKAPGWMALKLVSFNLSGIQWDRLSVLL